jgi:predicted DCC family thiol-disulfide oxidoreductase YuxK
MGAELITSTKTEDTDPLDVGQGIKIIYDGECPFCSAYVRMVRLKQAVGNVALINARERPDLVAELRKEGIDIDQTMVVDYGGVRHTGPRAIELLSLLSSNAGLLNRLSARILNDERRARFFYPILRCGRNLALRALGRRKINE